LWLTAILWVQYSWFNYLLKWNIWIMQRLGFILLNYFTSYHIWYLLIWFELSLIPIVLVLLGYGNQLSKLPATFYFLIYTLLFSLPVMVLILNMKINYNLYIQEYLIRRVSFWILLMCFLVKLPIFGLHFWLPKVHVESATLGSIVLAAILLKTGSYGIYLVIKWRKINIRSTWALFGSSVVCVVACLQVDIKKLIALSSVSHLNLAIAGLVTQRRLGLVAFILMSFTHGLVSNRMFYLAGVESSNSRLIYYLKGSLAMNWFLLLFLNISHPLCHSILGEGLIFMTLTLSNLLNILVLGVGAFCMIWFTIVVWLHLKKQVGHSLTIATSIMRWSYLIIFIMWLNSSMFM